MISNIATDVRAFTSNAFLVTGPRNCLVDTGANFDAVSAVNERVDELDAIVLTHTHPDHVGNLDALRTAFDVPVWGYDPSVSGVDRELPDESTTVLGDHEYTVLHTPGHKNDHVCLYAREPGILFAGDLVFENGGFGRTDLAEGNRDQLIDSIDRVRDRVDTDLTALHPGHGSSVTTNAFSHIERAASMARQL